MTGRGARGSNPSGGGAASSGPIRSKSMARQEKLLRAMGQVNGYHGGMRKGMLVFGDEEAWVTRWLADTRAEDNDIAAMERQFERIINEWQDTVFDVIEVEAAAQGKAPRPPRDAGDAARWSQEALAMGLIAALPANANETPNRWERQVLLGHLDPQQAADLAPMSRIRQLFSHRHSEADDEAQARHIWAQIQRLDRLVAEIADEVDDALKALWP
jgi:hypothetical protein